MGLVPKILISIGLCLFLCCGGGILLGVKAFNARSQSITEARSFAEPALAEIGKNWDFAVVDRYSDPSLREKKTTEQRQALYDRFRTALGPLVATSNWKSGKVSWTTKGTFVVCTCDATFKRGPGTVKFTCRKVGDHWDMYGIYIVSPLLK